ncbi:MULTISPECIES: LysR family transcriptional regulator [Pseudomonas]|jgi:DNA-binding transcriptional LysR family regulator|uniref:LysR family transcriptional regulator n=2 Tax=Pseudomonas extremaustralis TaxID=359110 RepID=A0A5C5QA90_9PSED|nr:MULTISPECIES: LysR family transcriptional regulator [Pseudomonas]EZI27835.1 LysR family transcriptional regulator [Pseudomonas extremaustralis 14-3 substr. 14-3b]HCE9341367.1 LysR family transcriptional regulator [Pseudomonas aeruginosa]MBJ2281393.1 LysR family transcriptional regulator [Pseudomonas sp. MF6767]MDW8840989.1 LysR family transcriptional regulator [Pseudomonas carnis]NMX44247.1 LysR family transcriptional regulator [Pseudomonas sp. WS 5407]
MSINIRFDLKQMKAFIAVAEHLHFKRAADVLFITQPALSRLIRALEEEVEAQLFQRTTRQVALTEAGRLFLHECQQVFRHIERGIELARSAAAGDIGHLTVAYNDFAINGALPAILERFKELHPNVTVELLYMPSHEQYKAIDDCLIDVGFLLGPVSMPGIKSLPVSQERMVAILPARHPLAGNTSIRVEQLKDERFIFGAASGWSLFREQSFQLCQRFGFTPNIIQEATTSIGIFGLVAANMGVSIYSECAYKIQREGVAIIPLENEHACVQTIAAWNDAYETPTAARFRALLQDLTA